RNFVIDLSGVTHIDSTGIGRFIAGFNRVFQAKGRLVMAGATGQVRDSFAVTRLDTVFRFYPGPAEALAALAG
ncbi:MAG: STAS domain-containing protein, partial [Acidobacteria bacterium]|nr:STAS domain-containing protein [Acidobacteriota bacterium]